MKIRRSTPIKQSLYALGCAAACAVMPLSGFMAQPAQAALAEKAQAPAFTAHGALDGKAISFSLQEALKKGPVVLYFFPAAFTPGCTLEAHAFADATDDFAKLKATVVGITAGNVDRVAAFSKEECRGKFAVLADPDAKVASLYKTSSTHGNFLLSDRTSYVIAPDGTILLAFTSSDPQAHVNRTMAAVTAWYALHS
ncbi:peroxiredoxin [Acetobacter cibinongensis]|uniref:peroxiredoxin n=1 Tax=Acetobacter cibinongensis TaxID=146475 RepID=UPI0006622E6D|nr:peroxiredoxin [Acetobacter cibinongensis]